MIYNKNINKYSIVFQISAFDDINKIQNLLNYFSKNSTDHNIIVLIHINKLSNKNIHDWAEELARNNSQVHIIPPIIVRWSHISHVHQKILGMKYLRDSSIHYDYYVCITESDIPIKPVDEMINLILENKHCSYFFDYFLEINKSKQYFELLTEYKFIERLWKTKYILLNEVNFSEYSLTHKWKWYFYPRNIEENYELSNFKRLIIKISRNVHIWLYCLQIIRFYFNPNKKNYIAAQKWQFGKPISGEKIKIYSEWQYSITSFFSPEYCNFILDNYEEYIPQFNDIYAPDESFWISMAKNFSKDAGTCIFDWKPMILGLINLFKPKNGHEMKLAWDYKDFHSIEKYDNCYVLFARKASSMKHIIDLMDFLKI